MTSGGPDPSDADVLSATAALLSRPAGRTAAGPRGRLQGFRDPVGLVTLVTVIATGMLLGTAVTAPRSRR